MSGIELRAATVADAPACAEIYRPSVLDSPISFEEQAPDSAEMAGRIEAVSATHPWLVAERDGSVLGYAYGSRHRERAGYRWAADVAVYVGSGSQGQGVGETLLEALLAELEARGYLIACAGITLTNEASVALHRAVGFEQVGLETAIGWKAGAWHDVSLWQRRLGEEDANVEPCYRDSG